MANEKDDEEIVDAPEQAEAESAKVELKPNRAAKSSSVTVKYRDRKGEPTERTFSKEVHGKDFADLADEFKKTNAHRIIEE